MNHDDALPLPAVPPLPCADCDGAMHIARNQFGLYYRCINYARCKGALPAMPDGTPRGRPRSKQLRAARKAIHDELRRLAAGDKAMNDRAYAWLAVMLRIPRDRCHAGRFDTETADRAVVLLRNLAADTLRTWRF